MSSDSDSCAARARPLGNVYEAGALWSGARLAAERAEEEAAADAALRQQAAIRAQADADASRQAAEEAERQRAEAERERAEAEARAREGRGSLWWVGVIVGVVVIGAGVGLGVGLSGGGEDFRQSDFGEVTQTLGSF